jgi:hypothetical protein
VRGVLVYCADFQCSHRVAMNAAQWPDDLRLSDIELRFVYAACGKRGADVRPDFNWGRSVAPDIGIRSEKKRPQRGRAEAGLKLRCMGVGGSCRSNGSTLYFALCSGSEVKPANIGRYAQRACSATSCLTDPRLALRLLGCGHCLPSCARNLFISRIC